MLAYASNQSSSVDGVKTTAARSRSTAAVTQEGDTVRKKREIRN